MLIIIFVGAQLFNYFLAITNLPMDIAEWIADMGLNRYLVLVAILAVYLVLGCVMDAGSMIILTIPIVFPLVMSMAFNPIWFGILVVRVTEMGLITPPVGLNVFIIKGISGVNIGTIFRGVFPHLVADAIQVVFLVAFPQIVLFLPNMMKA